MIDGAVGADRIGAQLARLRGARLAVGDIERVAVGRERHRARRCRVVGDAARHPGAPVVALEAQHRTMIQEGKDRRPERDHGMARIGEIDPVLPVDHEVARLIVILAVEQRIDRLQRLP